MALGKISFDIYGQIEGRWSVYSASKYRESAIEEAKELIGSGQFDAVKVVREDERSGEEEIVFFEEVKKKQKGLTVVPIEEAPLCETLEDVYAFESRKTTSRVLRKYLDDQGLTVFELLHSYGKIKYLTRNEDFLTKAVHTIARAQSRGTDVKQYERVESLYNVIEQITDRAEALDGDNTYYDLFKKSGLDALFETVHRDVDEENQGFRIRTALSKYLGEMADWQAKLLLMVEQAEKKPTDKAVVFIDEIIAEIFDGTEALQEVLGLQKNRAETLESLAQLSVGRYQSNDKTLEVLKRFNAVKADHPLPNTRSVMLDRIQRELGSTRPLTKNGREEDQVAFSGVLDQLVEHHTLSGENNIGEAATLRAKSLFVEEGQDESWENAIDNMLGLLGTRAGQFAYLVDLCTTDFGVNHQSYIIEKIQGIISTLTAITDLVDETADRRGVIRGAATVRDRLLSTKLPEEWRVRFARTIYTLLMDYEQGGVDKSPISKPRISSNDAVQGGSSDVAEKILSKKIVEAGNYIFREGESGSEAYLVAEGEIEITRKAGNRDVVIATVGKGSVIGEMALIDTKPRMASAKAITSATLTIIPKAELQARLAKLETFDPVMRRLMGIFVDRMRSNPVVDL